ncbi:MAG: PilZ domain-containing protein [Terriglobia bacterium]
MKAPVKTERRNSPRLDVAHPISFEWQSREGEFQRGRGTTRDIALGGVYCFLDRPLPVGQEVEFDVILPGQLAGGNPAKLHCRGRILRAEKVEGRGFGIAASIESCRVLATLARTANAARQRLFARVAPPSLLVAEYPGMRSAVRDLSLVGAFIEDERPLPVGRLFDLRLCSDKPPVEIVLRAIVRRVEPQVGMAVEFVALSPDGKKQLQEILGQGRSWDSEQAAFPSEGWRPLAGEAEPVQLEAAKEFLRDRAARALPQVEILGCYYRVVDRLFSLHLRAPFNQVELLLPLCESWVHESQQGGDSSHLDRALGSAARILDLSPAEEVEGGSPLVRGGKR